MTSSMARARPVEIDPLDVGPRHVLGALTAVDEDQHAGVPVAEIAGAIELQLLAAMERHLARRAPRSSRPAGTIEATRPNGMV